MSSLSQLHNVSTLNAMLKNFQNNYYEIKTDYKAIKIIIIY